MGSRPIALTNWIPGDANRARELANEATLRARPCASRTTRLYGSWLLRTRYANSPSRSGILCVTTYRGNNGQQISCSMRYHPSSAKAVSTRASIGVCPNCESMRFASDRC